MEPTTAALAQRLGLQPQTLRASVCKHGNYFGITPSRLPNGRLLWPSDSFERLTTAQVSSVSPLLTTR